MDGPRFLKSRSCVRKLRGCENRSGPAAQFLASMDSAARGRPSSSSATDLMAARPGTPASAGATTNARVTDSRRVGEHRLVGVGTHTGRACAGSASTRRHPPRGEQRFAFMFEHCWHAAPRQTGLRALLVRFLLQPPRPAPGPADRQIRLGLDDQCRTGIDLSGDMSHVVVDEHPHHLDKWRRHSRI